MIITKIEDLKKYENVNENFKTVVENTEKYSDKSLEKGKYVINEKVFAVVNSYDSAEPKPDFFENHRKYIDIQYVVSGSERIFTADAGKLTCSKEYDSENDFELFKTPDEYSVLTVSPGDVAVFFPGEAHLPGVAKTSGAEKICKVIFKVEI